VSPATAAAKTITPNTKNTPKTKNAAADAAAPARRKLGNTKWRKGLIPDQEFTYSFVAE